MEAALFRYIEDDRSACKVDMVTRTVARYWSKRLGMSSEPGYLCGKKLCYFGGLKRPCVDDRDIRV